jgi:hypothetical protein
LLEAGTESAIPAIEILKRLPVGVKKRRRAHAHGGFRLEGAAGEAV